MRKVIISLFVLLIFINTVNAAQNLELSDIIKQARENAMPQNQQADMQKAIQPVKNEISEKTTCEQNAAEKINPAEVLGTPALKQ